MADQDLNIHIKASDETAGALKNMQAGVVSISSGFENAGRSMRMMGREIGQIGSAMVMAGTAITAPMALAFKTAANFSPQIKQQIEDMTEQWDKMAISVAQSMMPVVQEFTNTLSNIVESWNGLTQAQRDNMVQTTLNAGEFLLFGGIAVKSIGEALKVGGDLFLLMGKVAAGVAVVIGALKTMAMTEMVVADGQLLIANTANMAAASVRTISLATFGWVGLIVGVVAIILSWKPALDTVANGFQKIYDLVTIIASGIDSVISGVMGEFIGAIATAMGWIEKVIDVIPGISKAFKDSFQGATQAVQQWGDIANKTADDMSDKAKSALKDLMTFNPGQNGGFANSIDGMKTSLGNATQSAVNFGTQSNQSIKDFLSNLKQLQSGVDGVDGKIKNTTQDVNTFSNGFLMAMQSAKGAWNTWEVAGETAGKGVMSDLQTSMSGFFDDVFTGQLTKASQVFANFGNAMLKTFSQVISQMITQWVASKLWSLMGGAAGFMGLGGATGGAGVASMGSGLITGSGIAGGVSIFHDGGPVGSSWANPVVAHDGLAVDEVPAVLQTGEGVLSRQGMQNLASMNSPGGGGGGQQAPQINITPVIQAWDASDVMRNMNAITQGIVQNIMNNGQIRTIMRQYS